MSHRRSARSVREALEQWSPVSLAMAIDRGLVEHTPLSLTPAGWRWFKRTRRPRDDNNPASAPTAHDDDAL